jgi:hypothetical protein
MRACGLYCRGCTSLLLLLEQQLLLLEQQLLLVVRSHVCLHVLQLLL